jgi:hypothetical protein
MKSKNKEQGSITIALDREIWKIFDEVHSEIGISKSCQAMAILKGMIRNKSDVLAFLKDEILSKRDALLEQALELENIAKGNQSEINRLDSISNAVEGKEAVGTDRARTNALIFTQDSVDGLRPQKKDVWFHDIQTKGLAIRSKKDGMTYYTRAKNEKLSKYTLRVKIADTRYMTLEKAKEVHAKNLKSILKDGINPNKAVPDIKNKGRHKNVATKETEDIKQASIIDWKMYSGIRYERVGLEMLNALIKSNPDIKKVSMMDYKNAYYKTRGGSILDCFETDGLSVYEISRKIQIAEKNSLPRNMSIQTAIYQICKSIYHFGSKEDKAIVFGGDK